MILASGVCPVPELRRLGVDVGIGVDGQLRVYPKEATDLQQPDGATIRLDAATGDILLANADCAEDFEIAARPLCAQMAAQSRG